MLRNWKLLFVCALMLGVLPASAQPPQEDEFVRAQKIVEQVRAGETTIEKAFADGLLSRPILLAILGTGKALDPGRGLWDPGPETYRWTKFLVEKYPEIFDDQTFMGYTARIRIAQYLLSKNDKRGALVLEKIVDEQPRKNPDLTILMSALSNLCNYYSRSGEYKKAVANVLVIREFETAPPQQAMILLLAARAARDGGDKENAQKLYVQVFDLGYGLSAGHAHNDMADILMQDGKLEDARALLKQPLPGLYGDQYQVILSGRLAQSYFRTGEWNEARKWAQTTIQQYEALGTKQFSVGVRNSYEDAKSLPEQIDRVQKNPIELLTPQINIKMSKTATQPVRTYFYIRSLRAITPKILSDDLAIQSWLFRQPQDYETDTKMFGVSIAPDILRREGKAEITISFAEFPDATLHIPIQVTVTN